MRKNMKYYAEKIRRKIRRNLKRQPTGIISDNRGVGIIEVVLILVILIAVVLIFKTEIMDIINRAFSSISNDSGNIIK